MAFWFPYMVWCRGNRDCLISQNALTRKSGDSGHNSCSSIHVRTIILCEIIVTWCFLEFLCSFHWPWLFSSPVLTCWWCCYYGTVSDPHCVVGDGPSCSKTILQTIYFEVEMNLTLLFCLQCRSGNWFLRFSLMFYIFCNRNEHLLTPCLEQKRKWVLLECFQHSLGSYLVRAPFAPRERLEFMLSFKAQILILVALKL